MLNTPQKVKIHKHNLALTWVPDQHIGAKCLFGLTFCEVFSVFSISQDRYVNRQKIEREEKQFSGPVEISLPFLKMDFEVPHQLCQTRLPW